MVPQLHIVILILDAVQIVLSLLLIVLVASLWKAAVNLNQSLRAVIQQPKAVLSHLETQMPPEERAAMLEAIGARLSELSLREILDAVSEKRDNAR